jgi:hypothetical protein
MLTTVYCVSTLLPEYCAHFQTFRLLFRLSKTSPSAQGIFMFGSAQSCRKQYGLERDDNLPSIRNQMTEFLEGRPQSVTVGALLVERSGKSLHELWGAVAAGFPEGRVPIYRIAERLTVAGAGILGPREHGQLQKILQPASDATVGFEQWAAAFGITAMQQNTPVYAIPPAGVATLTLNSLAEVLPHERSAASAPPPTSPSASNQWPGGFIEAQMQSDVCDRLAAGRVETQSNFPFGTDADQRTYELPVCGGPASPTFSGSCGWPHPFATEGSLSVIPPPTPNASTSTAPPFAITPDPHKPGVMRGKPHHIGAVQPPPFATNY